MAKLVIVESPAKAKTIGKYLGDDYEVTASMGHIRDLPASQLGIDVEHGYTPQYISIKGKEKLIKELKSKAKHADGVLLATDPDREGEAISWHLANILGLDPHAPNRVTFDEITKKGVKEGMAHPRAIDEDLFNAQQARRVLDRLVGYKLSPFLWRKVRRGLSAGRVQSVAVRLIDDREKEIESFKPDEYWNVDVTLGAGHKSFTARLATDSKGKKLLPKNEAEDRHRYPARGLPRGRGPRHRKGPGRGRVCGGRAEKGQARQAAHSGLYHQYPAAGGIPPSGLHGHPHHAGCPDPVRRRGHCRARYHGSDHLHAYRQPAHLGRSRCRCQGVYRRGLRRKLYLPLQAGVEDQECDRCAGRP